MKIRMIVASIIVIALMASLCGCAGTEEVYSPTPIPPAVETTPDETPTPLRVNVISQIDNIPQIPTPPVMGTPTPDQYTEYQIIDTGAIIKIWQIKDPKVMMSSVGAISLVLAVSDGPLPIGDIIAVCLIAGTTFYLVWRAVADSGVMTRGLPGLPEIPSVDWQGILHASQQRIWPLMFTLLVYAEVSTSPDGMYYGPTSGRILVLKFVQGWGIIGLVFSAQRNLTIDESHLPIGTSLVTIVYDPRSRADKLRRSDCASIQVLPVIGYNPAFEPPPSGAGTCLMNGNITE